jgi:hypothetical protein
MRICFSMRMTEKTRCAQSRQVGLNKTLADIRKIVGFKKLIEEPVKIDFYILKGLRFLCDYWNYRYNF